MSASAPAISTSRADDRLARRLREIAAKGSNSRGRDVIWATTSRIGTQALQFVATLVLARLLLPSAFGIVAVAQVFVGFANLFSDLGLGAALVRNRDLRASFVVAAFALNLALGLVLAGVIAAVAPALARAYDLPQLRLVLWIAALQSAANVTIVPLAILERAFRFRLIAAIEVGTAVLAVATSVILALFGLGPVALVIGPAVGTVAEGIVLWIVLRLPPWARFNATAFKEIWRYSGPMVLFNTLNYWARNVDNLVLGIVAGAAALGLYSRAYILMLVPVQQVTLVLSRVLLPALSQAHHSVTEMRHTYLRALRLSSTVTLPLGFGLTCLSTPTALVLFGRHWAGLSPILAILALTTPVQVIVTTTGPIYQAVGATAAWSKRSGVASAVTMVALCCGAIRGAEGVAVGWALSCFGTAAYLTLQPWRLISLTWQEALSAITPQLTSSLIMACMLLGLDTLMHGTPPAIWLTLGAAAGASTYAVALVAIDRQLALDLAAAITARAHRAR